MSERKKSARKSAKGAPFKKGKDPRRGKGPKPGRGGRPPDEFKLHMQALASSKEADEYLQKCLAGEFGPKFFLGALNYATDRGYGKAVQPITGEGGGPLEVMVTRRIIRADGNG